MALFHDDDDTATGVSQASQTYNVKSSTIRKGGYAMLQGFPCKVVEISKAQPGKHGHAKIHLIGLDIFTSKKHEDICPAKDNIEVPVINRADYQLIHMTDGFLELMDQAGRLRDDLRLPHGELGRQIAERYDKGEEVIVTLLCGMGQSSIISCRRAQ
jgi:translation initiation factor 5A